MDRPPAPQPKALRETSPCEAQQVATDEINNLRGIVRRAPPSCFHAALTVWWAGGVVPQNPSTIPSRRRFRQRVAGSHPQKQWRLLIHRHSISLFYPKLGLLIPSFLGCRRCNTTRPVPAGLNWSNRGTGLRCLLSRRSCVAGKLIRSTVIDIAKCSQR